MLQLGLNDFILNHVEGAVFVHAVREALDHAAGNETTNNGDTQGNSQGSNLVTALGRGRAAFATSRENVTNAAEREKNSKENEKRNI